MVTLFVQFLPFPSQAFSKCFFFLSTKTTSGLTEQTLFFFISNQKIFAGFETYFK